MCCRWRGGDVDGLQMISASAADDAAVSELLAHEDAVERRADGVFRWRCRRRNARGEAKVRPARRVRGRGDPEIAVELRLVESCRVGVRRGRVRVDDDADGFACEVRRRSLLAVSCRFLLALEFAEVEG